MMSFDINLIVVVAIFLLLIIFVLLRQQTKQQDLQTLKILQDTLQKGTQDTRISMKESLTDYAAELGKRVENLTNTTELRLKEINDKVEKRLAQRFEKTNETFTDVVKRLALIDAAQKKITELSSRWSLQETKYKLARYIW